MTNKHKRWSTLFLIKEKHYHFSPTKDPGNDPKRFIIPCVVKNVEKELLCNAGGLYNLYKHFREQTGSMHQNAK